jgi:hypothetical protein
MPTHPLSLAVNAGVLFPPIEDSPSLRHQTLGDLFLPTGNVVACDPFSLYTPVAFLPKLEPGVYPVSVAVAQWESGDQRVALGIVRVTAEEPAHWEMAKSATQGPDYNLFAPHGIYRYSVDYACGCFMDLRTAQELLALMDEKAPNLKSPFSDIMNGWLNRINDQMAQTYVNTWSWANVVVDPKDGLNMIIFSSGIGDGAYVSYWGYDANGRLACLVTDFLGVATEGRNDES